MAADKGVFALEASIERVSELMHIGSSLVFQRQVVPKVVGCGEILTV